MKRLISLAVGISAGALLCAGAAQAEPVPGPNGSTYSATPPAGTSGIVAAKTATCNMKRCRFQVSCVGSLDPEPQPCLLNLALGASGHGLITSPTENIVNPETGEPEKPWPAGRSYMVRIGETTTLVLQTIPPTKKFFRKLIQKGKRKIRGDWGANRLQFVQTAPWPNPPDFLFQSSGYGEISIRIK